MENIEATQPQDGLEKLMSLTKEELDNIFKELSTTEISELLAKLREDEEVNE